MQYVRWLGIVTSVLLIIGSLAPVARAAPRPANEVFQLSAQPGEEDGVQLNWSIAAGYYLYRHRVAATLNGKPLNIVTSRGEFKDDPTFGLTEIYRSAATAMVAGSSLPEAGEISVTYQGCAEDVICYPPITKLVDLATLLLRDPPESGGNNRAVVLQQPDDPAPPIEAGLEAESGLFAGGTFSMLAAFLGFGLLLSFTPCVFPMIPILSGMLARSGGVSMGRGIALSGTYVVAMASAYGVLGVFAAWSGENLQLVLQTPWAVSLMSAVFLVLALSMFGLFELRLPQAWSSRLAGAAGQGGSLRGAAVLGFGSALIVGPCVTPPLAAALVFVAQTGNAVRGSSALFALGLGMGLPLLLFGVVGAKALPKSGPWLARINRVFGFVFVGLAIWMASRVLPFSLAAVGWGLLLVAIGLSAAVPAVMSQRTWKSSRAALTAGGLAATAYGCAVLVGVASQMNEPLRPLVSAGLIASASAAQDQQSDFQSVSNESALDAAIASAGRQGRMMLLDFSAEWCTECKVMERTVLSEAIVRRQLRGMLLIRADLTHFDQSSKNLMKRFSVIGPPTMIFLNPDGSEISDARIVGGIGTDGFLSKIAKALHA